VASFLLASSLRKEAHEEFKFSSLSESGFIPTGLFFSEETKEFLWVLISFREWLHSYMTISVNQIVLNLSCSHLFQRVASFLLMSVRGVVPPGTFMFSSLSESGFIPTRKVGRSMADVFVVVLISFREWLHSYLWQANGNTSKLRSVLISFREWLHSYMIMGKFL